MKVCHLQSTKPTSPHPNTHTKNSSLASHSSYSKDPSLMRSHPQRLAPNSFPSLTAHSPFLVSSVFHPAATLAFLWFLRASHMLSPLPAALPPKLSPINDDSPLVSNSTIVSSSGKLPWPCIPHVGWIPQWYSLTESHSVFSGHLSHHLIWNYTLTSVRFIWSIISPLRL